MAEQTQTRHGGKVERKNGEYWVYLTTGTKQLSIYYSKLLPLNVDVISYLQSDIKSGNTYRLVLSIPEMLYNTILTEPNESYVISSEDKIDMPLYNRVSQQKNNDQFTVTNDIMSVPIQRKDLNGNTCALLKLLSQHNNLSFEGNIIGQAEYKNNNQYWIYLSPGSQKVKIISPDASPVEVSFIDHGIHHLESKKIYEYTYKGIPTQKLRIHCTPSEATVLIDGVIYDGEQSIIIADLPLGEHSYIVAARGYVTAEGVVKLKSEGETTLNITLSPL